MNGRDVFQPGKLWSLWGMLRAYAYQFAGLYRVVDELQRIAPPVPSSGPPILGNPSFGLMHLGAQMPRDELASRTRSILDVLPTFMSWVSLPSTAPQVERLNEMLKGPYSRDELLEALRNLGQRLYDDLKRLKFLHVRSEDAPYYEEPDLFGEVVADRFPEARDDIENAGRCLALRQGTASVFHLMRVMERALKIVGAMLGIPYAPSWEAYINQINSRIGARRKTKGIAWRRDEPFFRDLVGDIIAIKYAWRNTTMHVIRDYTPDEAEEILKAVKRFMVRLAERIPEKPQPNGDGLLGKVLKELGTEMGPRTPIE